MQEPQILLYASTRSRLPAGFPLVKIAWHKLIADMLRLWYSECLWVGLKSRGVSDEPRWPHLGPNPHRQPDEIERAASGQEVREPVREPRRH